MSIVDKKFKQALKESETIVVRIEDNRATIEFVKKEYKDRFGWTIPERRMIFNDFRGFIQGKENYTSATFVVLSKEISGFQALEYLIKEGDELRFRVTDDRNNYLKFARIYASDFGKQSIYHTDYQGLHRDKLTCAIIRKGKWIIQSLFLKDVICPDNTARAAK